MASVVMLFPASAALAQVAGPENNAYATRIFSNGSVELRHKTSGAIALFKPDFLIVHRPDDPKLHTRRISDLQYISPAWHDDKDEAVFDYFHAGKSSQISGSRAVAEQNSVSWVFESAPEGTLQARLLISAGDTPPVVRFSFQAKRPGWYSIGYAGAPAMDLSEVDGLWQPLIWQEKRFPYASFLSPEFACTLPATFVSRTGSTFGLVADPQEIPFRFATPENSRFGVVIRNREGQVQPLLFAPVLGGESSLMRENDTFTFNLRLYVGPGDTFTAYTSLARQLFGFRDQRQNISCPLNTTIENMISFAMNDTYSGWNAEFKASDYRVDVKDSVKTVSALHPLSAAIVTDNEQIYRRRAVPTIEYLMSREKYLFVPFEPEDLEQSPSHRLKGPAAEVSELAALELMSQGASSVFGHYAHALWDKPRALNMELISEGGSWQNALALYRLTGETRYLEQARKGADEYIAKRITRAQTDFSDARIAHGLGGQFWTDFAPKWIDLLQLFEASGERTYLDAAHEGAKRHAMFAWVHQFSKDRIVVNKGNKVGTYAFQNRLFENSQPMTAAEQTIDAWHVSPIGLTPEASNTHRTNRAVFLAHHAPYMLRLYGYTKDTFFRDIARSAIVGRYANYPGYNIYGEYSNIYQRADYPLRSLSEATFNLFYYNHIWPHITLLIDFLVTDAVVRSGNQIDFPRRYAQGYAYLQCDVYGDRPGTFYGDTDVQLWLPPGLLTTDNIQANYIAAYGSDNLYLCFLNQSDAAISTGVRLNPLVVPYDAEKMYSADVWMDNQPAPGLEMRNGELIVPVSGKGITAVRLKGLRVTTQFQSKLHHQRQQPAAESFHERETAVGKVTDMIIDMGPSLKNVYVWLQASEKDLREVVFSYRIDGAEWKKQTDARFPFELSVPLDQKSTALEYRIDAQRPDGTRITVEGIQLKTR